MVGVACIVIGIIIFFIGLKVDPVSAVQQTVQYLTYVCSSIFIMGGLIWLKLDDILDVLSGRKGNPSNKKPVSISSDNENADTRPKHEWRCPSCGEMISEYPCAKCKYDESKEEGSFKKAKKCPHCGTIYTGVSCPECGK